MAFDHFRRGAGSEAWWGIVYLEPGLLLGRTKDDARRGLAESDSAEYFWTQKEV
jgi:hypothetical protein